jgi:hypothetical protein
MCYLTRTYSLLFYEILFTDPLNINTVKVIINCLFSIACSVVAFLFHLCFYSLTSLVALCFPPNCTFILTSSSTNCSILKLARFTLLLLQLYYPINSPLTVNSLSLWTLFHTLRNYSTSAAEVT